MKSKFNRIGVVLSFIFSGLFFHGAWAQDQPESVLLKHDDGSVEFRYRDTAAQSVKLYCDCRLRRETYDIRRENYHSVKLRKDTAGWWTYTTPPLPSEIYTYQFEKNGHRFPDPTNPDSIRVRREKMSVFIMGGARKADLCVSDPLRGRVDTVEFRCGADKKVRRILVYLPPQYFTGQETYPALYLLHGLNGNETAWNDRGRAAQVLDNLIAEGKAKPMVLVMPDANPECLISQKENIGIVKNIMLYPTWNDREFELCFPGMDAHLNGLYRLSSKPGSRAVAGLSAGAKQAANLANMYDSTFSAVGMFSPVVGRKQLPRTAYAKYWIGGGTGDLFHHRINKFRKRMQRNHNLYTMYNTRGGHTWRNWRVYFTEFVQTLFWN